MRLLCLTSSDWQDRIPGLEVLSHEVRSGPLGVRIPTTTASQHELLLVDATSDIRAAKLTCLELAQAATPPRLLFCTETALTAVTAEWRLTDVVLATASPAEIEMRLRLAVAPSSAGVATSEGSGTPQGDGRIHAAGVVIDEHTFTARVKERTLDLTYKEFELLHFLVRHPARVFTREQLLSEVWGTDYYGGTRTVDVHVRRLRAKLGEYEALIDTVRGVGYGFARASVDPMGEGES